MMAVLLRQRRRPVACHDALQGGRVGILVARSAAGAWEDGVDSEGKCAASADAFVGPGSRFDVAGAGAGGGQQAAVSKRLFLVPAWARVELPSGKVIVSALVPALSVPPSVNRPVAMVEPVDGSVVPMIEKLSSPWRPAGRASACCSG